MGTLSKVIAVIVFLVFLGYFTGALDLEKVKEGLNKLELNKVETKLNSCESKAKELIPDYLILSTKEQTQLPNYWGDGGIITTSALAEKYCKKDKITLNNFRKGSNTGENINNYYFNSEPDPHVGCNIVYSKTVISKQGEVLGTTIFNINPLLKLKDKQVLTDEGEYDGNTDTYTFRWFGFNDEMKNLYGFDKIKFKIIIEKMSGTFTICEYESSDESGEYVCEGIMKAGWDGKFGTSGIDDKFIIEPDIYDNKIYEIIEPNLDSCSWVENEN